MRIISDHFHLELSTISKENVVAVLLNASSMASS